MKKRTLGNTLLYLYPFFGMVFICLLSFWQKRSIGADATRMMGYIIPTVTGLMVGCAVSASGYWYRKAFIQQQEKCEQVAALNKQHEDFMQTLSEGICTVDSSGICLYVNTAALGIFAGYEAHEFLTFAGILNSRRF